MVAAAIGILGVILGGALNAVVGYLLTRRREQREIKAAARVLLPELLLNIRSLEVAITFKRWQHVDFETRRWKDHEQKLAGCLGGAWQHVSLVYTAFELLNADRDLHDAPDAIDDADEIDYMVRAEEEARHAVALLQEVAGIRNTASLMLPESLWV